jgi:hypothetical protein
LKDSDIKEIQPLLEEENLCVAEKQFKNKNFNFIKFFALPKYKF